MSEKEWRTVQTRLKPDEVAFVEKIAAAEDRSLASILRRLVREAMRLSPAVPAGDSSFGETPDA